MLFTDWTLEKLDKTFGLKPLPCLDILQSWLNGAHDISEQERGYILILQQYLQEHVDDWNEQELALYFIGPIFALVRFDYERKMGLFAERFFGGVVEGIEINGRPDAMIASGYREPDKPYFCFQEYKKERDPNGDPAAQALAAMLVAQEINEHQFPIYGFARQGI